jgi:hypothetical protein
LGINLVKQIDVEAESIWTDVPAEETWERDDIS